MSAILLSVSGVFAFSAAISCLMRARIAVADAAPPVSVATWLPKKYLSSNVPRGVSMYFWVVTREIADMLSLHESTISRVTTQKYMLTPRGTFELKYFFGSHVATDTGGAASATAIRALIKQLIAAEDTKTPLTDSKIADMLGEQGILVARRTIAKYREALQIPPVNMRKAL